MFMIQFQVNILLEVSSPGWDRPFSSSIRWLAILDKQVALRLISAVDNRRKFQTKTGCCRS